MHILGYYVNNHGSGHLNRLFCFIKELEALHYDYKLYVFTETPRRIHDLELPVQLYERVKIISLPSPSWKLTEESKMFHCLPSNYKDYFGKIVSTCIKQNIHTFVSDLSVEVGLAVRLHVDKLVYVLLHGSRIDSPHQTLFHEADKLIVPFDSILEDSYLLSFRQKFNLHYSGGFLKFQYLSTTPSFPSEYNPNKTNVLIILGTGGDTFNKNYIDVNNRSYNVVLLGKQRFADPFNYLYYADVVVANAGDSILHEISYFNKPYICIPEERPFEEQAIKAMTLEREGYALLSNWNNSLQSDLLSLLPQKHKSSLIQHDKAYLYTQQIINC